MVAAPLLEIDGSKDASQLVVEQAHQLDAERDLGAALQHVDHQTEQAVGCHRCEAEDHHFRKARELGEADRVLVESFVSILEQLEARGIALEVVDD